MLMKARCFLVLVAWLHCQAFTALISTVTRAIESSQMCLKNQTLWLITPLRRYLLLGIVASAAKDSLLSDIAIRTEGSAADATLPQTLGRLPPPTDHLL